MAGQVERRTLFPTSSSAPLLASLPLLRQPLPMPIIGVITNANQSVSSPSASSSSSVAVAGATVAAAHAPHSDTRSWLRAARTTAPLSEGHGARLRAI